MQMNWRENMGRWYHGDKLSIYLYDRSQQHGNHNYSHFHVRCKDGTNSVFNILGVCMEGSCKYEEEVSKLIKRNRNHINNCLMLLSEGKAINEVDDTL